MVDLIKELNLIDLLGILFPGALLVFLFGEEFLLREQLAASLGAEESILVPLAWILILGGYAVGMLLHEAGDLLEFCTCHVRILNPRFYAAIATKLYFYGNHKTTPMFPLWNQLFIRNMVAFVAPWPICYTFFLAFGVHNTFRWSIIADIAIGFISCCVEYKDVGYQNFWIIMYNDEMLLRHCQNHQKRILFEGFRTMARNLFVGVALVRLYTIFFRSGILGNFISEELSTPARRGIFSLFMMLIFLRYIHYTYLKYKYCYEDYLNSASTQV